MKGFFDSDFKEIFSSQVISLIGGIIAGVMLAVFTENLLLIPGILILLPGFLELRGNISGSMSARLTSGLFLGIVNPKSVKTKIVSGNIIASFALAVIVCLVLGTVAFIVNLLVFNAFTPNILFIPLVAGIIANAVEIPLALFFTFYLFRKGHDPNNVMGPFLTSTGDVLSVLALLFAVVVF